MDGPLSERISTPEIVEAITTTLANARVEGDPYTSKAEEHLGPIEAILLQIGLDRIDVQTALKREETALENLVRKTDTVLEARSEELWSHLGCPNYDPIYNILFPPVSATHELLRMSHPFQAPAEHLSLIADLLSSGMHPKIDRDLGLHVAQEVRALATEFHDHLHVLSKHKFRKSALDAFEASVARIGLLELGTLRRALRTMGLDDSRIKLVVPPPVSMRRPGPKS
jgi:hypothetical protein